MICMLLFCMNVAIGQDKQLPNTSISLTLAQVWEKAAVNSKSIQMQQLRVESSKEEILDAKAERLPEINAMGEYARVSNLPVYTNGLFHKPEQFEVVHTSYRFGGEAYFNLYNGNKVNNNIARQQINSNIRAEQKNMTVSEIKVQAAAYYLDLHRSNIFKTLIQANIADQEKQLAEIRQLHKNGVVLKSDVLRAELQLSRQQLTLTQIQNDIAIANQKLNILMGEPDEIPVITQELPNLEQLPPKTYEEYLATAMSNSYQNKISEQETKLRRLQLKDVRGNVSPKIGLFANYAYSYPQIQFYPYSIALYGVGLAGIKATFPIDAIYHNRHKEKAAEIEFKEQEIEHHNTQDIIRQKVKEAYLRYEEALNRIQVAQTNIQQATESSRIVSNTYFNQLSLVTELLESNTQLLQSRFDLAAAQIAAQLQYYQLQNAIGNL
ncbi:MAG: transporter [Pedobacter sp.]|nr:transporter [Pedobacter sp.]